MESYWIKAIHVDSLRHAPDSSLGIVDLILHKLDRSFQVQGFYQGCLSENHARRLITKWLCQLRISLVGLGQNLVKKFDCIGLIAQLEISQSQIVE